MVGLWCVGKITEKLLNRFQRNKDGGWVSQVFTATSRCSRFKFVFIVGSVLCCTCLYFLAQMLGFKMVRHGPLLYLNLWFVIDVISLIIMARG